jgi:hypothetical protein
MSRTILTLGNVLTREWHNGHGIRVYAALRWPSNDVRWGPNNDTTVVAAWTENRYIVSALIHRAFTNYEKALVNRIGDKEPQLPNAQTE